MYVYAKKECVGRSNVPLASRAKLAQILHLVRFIFNCISWGLRGGIADPVIRASYVELQGMCSYHTTTSTWPSRKARDYAHRDEQK